MNDDVADDLNACAQLVEKGDPDRFLAVMAAPPDARARLFPLYAFNLEVARAPWVTQENMIAEMRLQWWRDALEEMHRGSTVRRHEVVTPLAQVLAPELTPLLDDMILARRWDIYRDPFEDEAAFSAHIDQTAGNLLVVAVRMLGEADEDAVRDTGFAAGLANWFLAIPALEAAGRVPLVDGRPDTVRALAEGALTRLTAARARRSSIAKPARPALLSAWRAEGILRQVAADPSAVAEGRIGESEFRRRAGLMWKAATGSW